MKKTSTPEFETDVLDSDKPVLVKFGAVWCGPCKMIAPLLEQIAQERQDVRIVEVDVDESRELAMKHQIRGVPTLILFKDGVETARGVGVKTKSAILSLITGERTE